MPPALSHTPPGRVFEDDESGLVRRRRVLFVPGYDPEGETRYRMLFVRELLRHAKRFGVTRRELTRAVALPDLPGQSWKVGLDGPGWSTDTAFEVLRWDDIVRKDFARPLPVMIVLLYAGLLYAGLTGMIARLWRLHWKFGCVVFYPSVTIALVLAAGIGAGFGVAAGLSYLAAPPAWGRAALVLGVAGLVFAAFHPFGERWYVWHLMHDWVFNLQQGMGWRPDYEARTELFARHLVEALREGGVDEVLVLGHSSGATLAVDLVGRAMQLDPAVGRQARLSLLTVGTCVPLVAFNPAARRYRERMALLMESPDVFWAEYQAPQDWLNLIRFAPIRDMPVRVAPEACRNPVVRSPSFKSTVAAKTYEKIVFQPFRMHFQFLIANDHPGEYDYVMMVAGPLTLEDRVRLGVDSAALVLGGTPAAELDERELAEAERERFAAGSA